ncbi:SMP-30/gluconolactonase/LRE family protein [Paraburkholderia panacisoli]|uniref:SMP-30/gluconolactonase/LRE family protein n=1 Tax=Paraburkholderia panacisoli TaxID=2603818 RepID=UPI001FE3A510|nr:SMP-30/gluconolactonase/LRE family protein [Paraburkholderia panacisoli]
MNPLMQSLTPKFGWQPCHRAARGKGRALKRLLLTTLYGTSLALSSAGSAIADDLTALLPPSFVTSSTVPTNGDLNPYGVVFVPDGFPGYGTIAAGDLLVSNFNNSQSAGNLQGKGTTIVKIVPRGNPVTFFQGPARLGLSTALGVLRAGFVLVGNVPTVNGTSPTAGSLLVINRSGRQIAEWMPQAAKINGPWDLTIFDEGDHAKVFVSNVLDGTVTRLDVSIDDDGVHLNRATRIASDYAFRPDPSALVLGPTGLAYDPQRDVLYVASTADNAIFAVSGAGSSHHEGGKGVLIYADNARLHGPLGMALGPNGHLFAANGDAINPDPKHPSEIIEFTPQGRFVARFSIDPAVDGPFGIAFGQPKHEFVRFAAVDDNTNTVTVWHLPFENAGQ